jgi:hypothetical protein
VVRSRSAAAALVVLFLGAHLVWLPRTLEDLDSVNFALGVREFDVAKHQPHPPGYPICIALAKASTASLRFVGVDAPAPRGSPSERDRRRARAPAISRSSAGWTGATALRRGRCSSSPRVHSSGSPRCGR